MKKEGLRQNFKKIFKNNPLIINNQLNKSKKAQFYLIAAAVIIVIIIGLASVNHSVIVKDNQEKAETLIDFLNYEAISVIEYSYANSLNDEQIENNIEQLTQYFSEYSLSSQEKEFGLYVFYGEADPTEKTLKGKSFISASTGGVQADEITVYDGKDIETNATFSEIFEITEEGITRDYINITIGESTYLAQVSNDNNFMVILTTSDGFNNYVVTNVNGN